MSSTSVAPWQLPQPEHDAQPLSVVPRPAPARGPFVAVVSITLLLGVVGLLVFNTGMQQAAFEQEALQEQADNLAAREQTLILEVEKLRDPQSVARRAEQLGMVIGANPAFLNMETGKVSGSPAPAPADDGLRIRRPAPPKPKILVPDTVVVRPDAQRDDQARRGTNQGQGQRDSNGQRSAR